MTKPHESIKGFVQLLTERKCNFFNPSPANYPVVSIISSFFNAHQYFEETYQSIINQTFQNFEWIIVEDRSTEPEAISLFKCLSQRTSKIKTFYHQYNKGPSTGRNTAISEAKGKYLFFIDLDDILDPTYIEKCVLFLETNPEFSFVNSYTVCFQAYEYWWDHGFNLLARFIEENWVTGRLLYRKADFDQLGGFDEELRFYEDWERWLKAIANHQKGWTIPEYLDCYRRTETGLLVSSRKNVTEEQRVTELIQSRYKQFFAENELPQIFLPKHTFDISQLRLTIKVENTLQRQNLGKQILCWLPCFEVGGSDKFNLDLFTLLKQRGYDLTLVTTLQSSHPWHSKFYEITPDIFHLPNLLHPNHWLAFARYIIKSRQIDIFFISNSYFAYYLLPFLRNEFPHVAFVDYTHNEDPGWQGGGYPRVSCQFSQFLECQGVASKYLGNYYQQLNPDTKDKIRVCYINTDSEKWQPDLVQRQHIRSKLGISKDTVVLIFPARLEPQKRPLFLVEIVKELVNKSLPISVISLGTGSLFVEMQSKIEQLKLKSVFHIFPPVFPEEMIGFYSASDILLLPSEYEGISLSIYEAMSMQLPIIASDVGGQQELVTPETGFLIPKGKGDVAEVQEYLKVLVPLIQDAELRCKVGSLARQRVAELFSLEMMADQMEAIFASAKNLRKIIPQNEVNLKLAEEMLTWFLEYSELEKSRNQISWTKHMLEQRVAAMETSKFWKFRKLWFKVKRKLRLTQEEA